MPSIALNLYRRLGRTAQAGARTRRRTYEADELRRGWENLYPPELSFRYPPGPTQPAAPILAHSRHARHAPPFTQNS